MTDHSDGFERVGELSRQEIGGAIRAMVLASTEASDSKEPVQAIMLGALAAVVECWVSAIDVGTTRARLVEALSDTIRDFVDQAFDAQGASIQ